MCIVLTGAGITDLRNGKVYNWWLVFGLAAGILCRGTAFFPGAAFFLIPSFLLFCFRMIGAGDGKLAAVTGGFLGIRGGLSVAMIGLFLGALWSAGRMWKDRSFGLRMGYLFRYAESLMGQKTRLSYDDLKGLEARHRIPLAACLSAGGYLYLFGTAAVRFGGYVL